MGSSEWGSLHVWSRPSPELLTNHLFIHNYKPTFTYCYTSERRRKTHPVFCVCVWKSFGTQHTFVLLHPHPQINYGCWFLKEKGHFLHFRFEGSPGVDLILIHLRLNRKKVGDETTPIPVNRRQTITAITEKLNKTAMYETPVGLLTQKSSIQHNVSGGKWTSLT